MYIQFKLPSGAGGMAALYVSRKLKEKLTSWAVTHNIQITSEHRGYGICFKLARPEDYTLFALSWTVSNIWDEYEVINDES